MTLRPLPLSLLPWLCASIPSCMISKGVIGPLPPVCPLAAKPHSNHRITSGRSFLTWKCDHITSHIISLSPQSIWNLAQIPLPGTHVEPKINSPTPSPTPPSSSHCALYSPEMGMLPPIHTHFSLCLKGPSFYLIHPPPSGLSSRNLPRAQAGSLAPLCYFLSLSTWPSGSSSLCPLPLQGSFFLLSPAHFQADKWLLNE